MTTYYVDPSGGSDAAAGTSFGTAWLTTQKALDTAVAGDEVRLCQTATETISAKIDVDTARGDTTSGFIEFISYDATGTTQADGYTIQASASIAHILDYTTAGGGIRWTGVDIDGNSNTTSHNLNHSASDEGNGTHYVRCQIHDGGSNGAEIRGEVIRFFGCDIYGNGGDGVRAQATSSSRWPYGAVVNCKIHDNTGDGIGGIGYGITNIVMNEIYDNGGAGIESGAGTGTAFGLLLMSNTVYGNGSHGIEIENYIGQDATLGELDNVMLVNNTSSGNGGYGFYYGTSTPIDVIHATNNHTYNNTSGATDRSAGMPGSGNVTGDPLFVSVVDGSEDFAPGAGSPLIQAGAGGTVIGALSPAAGGGGGGLKIAGRSGLAG